MPNLVMIELHETSENARSIWVNVNRIDAMRYLPHYVSTQIFVGDNSFSVSETPEDIMQLIDEVCNDAR